jgi:hypothetical protein
MKITRRQLRRIIRETIDDTTTNPKTYGGAKGPFPDRYGADPKATTPEVFADQNSLQLELDNEGQKIIYLSNEEADRLDMPPGVDWTAESADSGWIIYTGEYQ